MLMARSDSCRYIYQYKIMRSTKVFAQTWYTITFLLAFCANLSFFKHGFLLNFCLRDIIPSIGRFYKILSDSYRRLYSSYGWIR